MYMSSSAGPALLLGEQVAYVGQRLYFSVVGIGHAFIDPIQMHQRNDPAQAEGGANGVNQAGQLGLGHRGHQQGGRLPLSPGQQ